MNARAFRWAGAAAVVLRVSFAAAQAPEQPNGDRESPRIEICASEDAAGSCCPINCCPVGVVDARGLPAVSGDGARFALPLISGGLDEFFDLKIMTLRGRQVLRKVIYRKPDCTEAVTRGERYDRLSPRVARRAAEANALLKRGRYRPLPPVNKEWRGNESPHLLTGAGLRLEIDVRRERHEVLTVTKGGKVVFRSPVPGIPGRDPERCGYHAPRLWDAWLWRERLLVLLAYETGDDCGELNPPPRWLPPIRVPP